MKTGLRLFFFILLGILFFEVLMLSPHSIEDEVKEPPAPKFASGNDGGSMTTQAEHMLQGIHLVESSSGKKDWELWADEAFGSQGSKGDWILHRVKVLFYSENGVSFIVTGKEGKILAKSKDMEIKGDVITRSSNGYEIHTPTIIYNSVSRVLTSPEQVLMLGPQQTLKVNSAKLEAYLQDSNIVLSGGVQGDKKFNDGRVMAIKSNRAEFSGRNRATRFVDNVVIDVEAIRISGPEAIFQQKETSDELESVLVKGGVKVSDLDKWAVSERVTVVLKDNKFIFRGSPRVVQDKDELRGEEIVFLDGGKRVQVTGARAKIDEEKWEHKN